jgi:hypothetical protein
MNSNGIVAEPTHIASEPHIKNDARNSAASTAKAGGDRNSRRTEVKLGMDTMAFSVVHPEKERIRHSSPE